MHGGAADRSGLIHPGDEVVEVNGIDVLGKTPNDVLEILVSYRSIPITFWLVRFRYLFNFFRFSWQQNAEGTITFKLIPSGSQRPSRENRVRVRALFDFTAALDRYIVSLANQLY
jgi:hypothetical protein